MPNPLTAVRLSSLLRGAMAPLMDLLDDPEILHISITPKGTIWAERFGTGTYETQCTISAAKTEQAIRLIANETQQIANRDHSRLQATLPGGERVQAFLPPTTPAPAMEIRKPASRIYTMGDYREAGILTTAQETVLVNAVKTKQNIVVAGGTGTGKTTLLNALLDVLCDDCEHVVTLEDTPELQCHSPYYLPLRTTLGKVTLTDLAKDTLRVAPVRIIVGEIRGPEVLDYLGLLNSGHPGGMFSMHANPRKALRKIEFFIAQAPLTVALPLREVRYLIGEAIDMIVDIIRTPGAPGRKIQGITRCHGVDDNGQYQLEPLTEG